MLSFVHRSSIALSVSLGLAVAPAFALTITQDPNIAAGQAAFGPAATLFDWSNFSPGGTTWSAGLLGPSTGFASGADPVSGNVAIGNINLRNWIDGDGFIPSGVGFNAPSGAAKPDLAINGAENFTLTFTNPVSVLGFAVATGLGNLPSEFDHLGTVFEVTTNAGDTGTFTLVDPGHGYSAWISIGAFTPFTSLTFFEPSGSDRDQYFGNIFAPAIPEPETYAMMLVGLGLLGFAARRRKQKATAAA